ncbi:MAG TPA: arginine--tRNA ligase, partial [Alphaproteobacteria bacterium]
MNVFSHFRDEVVAVVEDLAGEGALPRGIDTAKVSVEPPRDAAHGDLATNAAMVLAKSAGRKPRELAELLAVRLGAHSSVTEASVAGPGFINLRLDPAFWQKRVRDALEAGTAYGDSTLGAGRRVNV